MSVMRASRLLLDTNVWFDYFMGEGRSLQAIQGLIEAGLDGRADLLYAPTSAKDLFYLIPRRLRSTDGSGGGKASVSYRPAAWACVERMMELATAAPLSHAECELARMLRSTFGDFEDNLIIAAGETAKADYIVTNDKPLLTAAPEACITPERALALLALAR